MFCKECGKKIPDDSKFCIGCGFVIDYIEGNEEPKQEIRLAEKSELQSSQESYNKRDVSLTSDKFNSVVFKETAFKDRIDSSDDPEVNEKLFTIYSYLVKPFAFIEAKTAEAIACENVVDNKAWFKKDFITAGYKFLKIMSAILIILSLLSLFRLEPVLESYISKYNEIHGTVYEDTGSLPDSEWYSGKYQKEAKEYYNSNKKIIDAYVSSNGEKMYKTGWWYAFIISPIIMAVIISAIYTLIYGVVSNTKSFIKNRNKTASNEELLKEIRAQIDAVWAVIDKYVVFVPQKYRNSTTLNALAEAYRNTQIDNLKDAATFLQNERIVSSLEKQNELLSEMNEHLNTIEENTTEMVNQLGEITDLLKLQNSIIGDGVYELRRMNAWN